MNHFVPDRPSQHPQIRPLARPLTSCVALGTLNNKKAEADHQSPENLVLLRKVRRVDHLCVRVGLVSLVGLLDVAECLLVVAHLLIGLGTADQCPVIGRVCIQCLCALIHGVLEPAPPSQSILVPMPMSCHTNGNSWFDSR